MLIVSNNLGNQYGSTVIAATITSQITKRRRLPTQVELPSVAGLVVNSLVQCEQLRTIDKRRLTEYITTLNEEKLEEVENALLVSLGLKRRKV